MATIDELLLTIPEPPEMGLDWTPNTITPPEDYDYPEKWDDAMNKWTLFTSRFPAWKVYIEAVAGIAVDAKDEAINAAISVSLPVITPENSGKALRAGNADNDYQYTFQEYGEVADLESKIRMGYFED